MEANHSWNAFAMSRKSLPHARLDRRTAPTVSRSARQAARDGGATARYILRRATFQERAGAPASVPGSRAEAGATLSYLPALEALMPGPLAHVTVLDLTDLRGALAGRLLADLGADVIKIEPPGGDGGRMQAPFAGGVAAPDRSLPFLYRNANKRGTVIDLHDPAGAERFADLCRGADMLLENYGLNRRQVLDLAPEAVRERYPELIHVIMADFGLSGPRAHWRAEPLVAFAASGALYASGLPERPPCWLPGFAAHDCAAVFAVVGALVALLDRADHGAGQPVGVSVQEAAISGPHPWQS